MKKFLMAVAALLFGASAHAADLPMKAPTFLSAGPCSVATATTPLSCSGFYVGGGLAGQGSNADILGSGISGSVFAAGITPLIDQGYLYANGNWIFGVELEEGYSFGTKAQINGLGNGFNGFRITEDFRAGGNLSALLGTPMPITIPAQLANSVLGLVAHIGTTQWQLPGAWANGTESGAALLFDIGPHAFGEINYTYTNFSSARAGGLTINDDNSVKAKVNYKF